MIERTRPVVGGLQGVEVGYLMGFGPDLNGALRSGAEYVDKILRGAKAADMPIEQPTNPARVSQSLSHRAAQETPPTQVGFFVCARCTVRSINGAIVRHPAGGLGNCTVATNCTGTLDFGPPTHFTYDSLLLPKPPTLS